MDRLRQHFHAEMRRTKSEEKEGEGSKELRCDKMR